MKNILAFISSLTLMAVLFSSCLTVEKKEYTFEFTGENSGILTIRFINIISTMDDGADVSESDFDELINTYLNGNELEDEYSLANITSKRLYEENDVLCAEVIIEFPDLASVKLHQFDKNAGYYYALCQCLNSESYVESNGTFASPEVPIVMWPAKTKKLQLVTQIAEPDESSVSLLPNYLDWKQ